MNTPDYLYFDYAASSPVFDEVIEAMMPFYQKYYGNPSNNINGMGIFIEDAIEISKNNIFELLNAQNHDVIFNSGATEGINTCLKSLYSLYGGDRKQIITCKTEHKAVIEVCNYLENFGAEIIYLPVDNNGNIKLEDLQNVVNNNTLGVVLMAVNNETGVMHDIKRISEICLENSIRFICDATQAVGKIKIDLNAVDIDYLILSGHKMYAPKGIGAILYKKSENFNALIHGGGQQKNFRSGTLNVPGIIGLGKAAEILIGKQNTEFDKIQIIQNTFESSLLKYRENLFVVSKDVNRSPFISNICFKNKDVEEILLPTRTYLSISTGSACSSQLIKPSHVLLAMGFSDNIADKCLRFSFGIQTTPKEVEQLLYILNSLLQ
nr:cysteine desulfurase family protein [uncultured Carboxylicivirga sp.]